MKKLLIILIPVLLFSCQKESVGPIVQPDDSTYIVRYFVNSDSTFIRYTINDSHYKHFISGHFDTTFYTNGGFEMMLTGTCFDFPMNAGIIVNDSIVINCFDVAFFDFRYYLK